jgi:type IV secretion system protein VirB9
MDRTPIVIEVPTPVAMPCQLKEPAEFERARKPGTPGVAGANTRARVGPDKPGANWVNAIQVYQFMPGALYQVHTAVYQVTTILLQPGERMTMDLAVGDTARWEMATGTVGSKEGMRVAIFLKPHWGKLRTNITIPTDRRIYLVEIQSNENGTYMAQVAWEYPQDSPLLVRAKAASAEEVAQTPAPHVERFEPSAQLCGVSTSNSRFHFGYRMETKARQAIRWKPERIFDDGTWTYVQFPANLPSTDAPALVGRSDEGGYRAVTYDTAYGCYIAQGVLNAWELRLGEQRPTTIHITRQAPTGGE